jgi:gas vesicle protein
VKRRPTGVIARVREVFSEMLGGAATGAVVGAAEAVIPSPEKHEADNENKK